METIDIVNEQYAQGFNTGYWLAGAKEKNQKDVLHDLMKRQNPEQNFTKGLSAGKKQMEKEQLVEKLRTTTKAKDKTNER